ncbi:hypothetical protein PCASD_20842 [Puccinia coronata f. sp. avenae]|uniref:Uncharacterized protein n=1 Tax=Puccinia coronata f. sp. avenae TaxID=200324 RepID=A0A2N5TYD7_9BASI|nr:hypothetical protein PCASD_20842 [Puccinia coronata f. sp. avenae]
MSKTLGHGANSVSANQQLNGRRFTTTLVDHREGSPPQWSLLQLYHQELPCPAAQLKLTIASLIFTMPTAKKRHPAVVASTDFKPFCPSNHKTELLTFIYQVDPHAEVPTKILVGDLRHVAADHLEILRQRQLPPSSSEDTSSSLSSLSSAEDEDLTLIDKPKRRTPQSAARVARSPARPARSQPELPKPRPKLLLELDLQHPEPLDPPNKIEAPFSQGQTHETPCSGVPLSLTSSSLNFSCLSFNSCLNFYARAIPIKILKAQVTFAKSHLKRHKRPLEDEADEDSPTDPSENSSLLAQSDSPENNSNSESETESNSEFDSDDRAAKNCKGKERARNHSPSNRSNRTRNAKPPSKSVRPLKSALANKNGHGARSSRNRVVCIESSDDDRCYHTRSGYRPATPRPPSPNHDIMGYTEEGWQDGHNSYSRPTMTSYLQRPADGEQYDQDIPTGSAPKSHGRLKRRRYVLAGGGGDQDFVAAGLDHNQNKAPLSNHPNAQTPFSMNPGASQKSSWSFDPSAQPFQSNFQSTYGHQSAQSVLRPTNVAPSFGYHPTQSNVAPAFAYQPSSTHFDYSPQAFQNRNTTSFPANPSSSYNNADNHKTSGPKPFDYSQYWNTKRTKPQHLNKANSQSNGQGLAPSSQKEATFDFSTAAHTQEKAVSPPPSRFSQPSSLGNRPPPHLGHLGQAGPQGNQPNNPPPQPPGHYGQPGPQVNQPNHPPPPPPGHLGQSGRQQSNNPPPLPSGPFGHSGCQGNQPNNPPPPPPRIFGQSASPEYQPKKPFNQCGIQPHQLCGQSGTQSNHPIGHFAVPPGKSSTQGNPPSGQSATQKSSTQGNPPSGQSATQVNQTFGNFSFGQSAQINPPRPQIDRLNQSGSHGNPPTSQISLASHQFGQPGIRQQLPPNPFGQTSFPTTTPNTATAFWPTSVEPTTNNPFGSEVPSNVWESRPAPPPPGQSTHMWVKPILKTNQSNPTPTQSALPHFTPGPKVNFSTPAHQSSSGTASKSDLQRTSEAYDNIPSPPTSPALVTPAWGDSQIDDLCQAISRFQIPRPVAPIPRKKEHSEANQVHFADEGSFLSAAPDILAKFLGNHGCKKDAPIIDPQLMSGSSIPSHSTHAPPSTPVPPPITFKSPAPTTAQLARASQSAPAAAGSTSVSAGFEPTTGSHAEPPARNSHAATTAPHFKPAPPALHHSSTPAPPPITFKSPAPTTAQLARASQSAPAAAGSTSVSAGFEPTTGSHAEPPARNSHAATTAPHFKPAPPALHHSQAAAPASHFQAAPPAPGFHAERPAPNSHAALIDSKPAPAAHHSQAAAPASHPQAAPPAPGSHAKPPAPNSHAALIDSKPAPAAHHSQAAAPASHPQAAPPAPGSHAKPPVRDFHAEPPARDSYAKSESPARASHAKSPGRDSDAEPPAGDSQASSFPPLKKTTPDPILVLSSPVDNLFTTPPEMKQPLHRDGTLDVPSSPSTPKQRRVGA